jgi:hypothetical protein
MLLVGVIVLLQPEAGRFLDDFSDPAPGKDLGERDRPGRCGVRPAPHLFKYPHEHFSNSLCSREKPGTDVFGGTPNTARGTHALPPNAETDFDSSSNPRRSRSDAEKQRMAVQPSLV